MSFGLLREVIWVTQKNAVFECAPVGGYGSYNRFEKRTTVLVTYRQSQEEIEVLVSSKETFSHSLAGHPQLGHSFSLTTDLGLILFWPSYGIHAISLVAPIRYVLLSLVSAILFRSCGLAYKKSSPLVMVKTEYIAWWCHLLM